MTPYQNFNQLALREQASALEPIIIDVTDCKGYVTLVIGADAEEVDTVAKDICCLCGRSPR